MYTRKLLSAPKQIIKDGKPLFGTYFEMPKYLDIRGVKKPFRVLPLPTFITNMRIRCSISAIIQAENFIGTLDILDVKFFSFSEVILWNKSTRQKYAFRHISGIRRRVVPKNLETDVCLISSKRRYIRITWNKSKNYFSLLFNMKGDKIRPSFSGSFLLNPDAVGAAQIFSVLPAPTFARCTALTQTVAPVSGSIFSTKDDSEITHKELSGLMSFNIRRVYAKLRSKSEIIIGIGTINGKHVCFQITVGSMTPLDSYTYNENVLFYDSKVTPLPPVKITHPFGLSGKWIIQDTESMIDLSFSPISDNLRTLSIFILRTQYHTISGTFNGVLLTKDGESIVLKDFPGIAKKQYLRL